MKETSLWFEIRQKDSDYFFLSFLRICQCVYLDNNKIVLQTRFLDYVPQFCIIWYDPNFPTVLRHMIVNHLGPELLATWLHCLNDEGIRVW